MKISRRVGLLDALEFFRRHRSFSPAQLISISFAAAIGIGALLLMLPIAHSGTTHITLVDALFTSTSAVCVTGLIVVDTGSAFSDFGKVVIMLLIQAGGLGIMTLGTILALASGRRIGFQERMRLQAQINSLHVGGVVNLIRRIVFFVLIIELAGAFFLFLRFSQIEGNGRGVFYAIFHSISAFNNAGFAFYSDSLSSYVADPVINIPIMVLILLGGLGFSVVFNALEHLRRRHLAPLTLHSKIVLTTTLVLTVGGFMLLAIFEWTNLRTLGNLPVGGKLMAAMFQSVTPRTAGFNSVDYGAMRGPSQMLTVLLMFIGGSPGSTAGGIKTVTFFLLLGSAWTISKGDNMLNVFGRRIEFELVIKAGVIALFGIMLSGAAVTIMAMTDPQFELFALVFEAISAISTVGLSLGITSDLSTVGKITIIILMYLGRLGALTFALALIENRKAHTITYPAENVIIG
ncbi:MAG: TrkH family potassium uptake protein [Caldilineaceae bacterium]